MNPKALQILLKSFGLDPVEIKAKIDLVVAVLTRAGQQMDDSAARLQRVEAALAELRSSGVPLRLPVSFDAPAAEIKVGGTD